MSYRNVTGFLLEALEDPFGVYANGMLLTADGEEYIVDFCSYSERENRARVVSRVRVHRDFLKVMREKIDHDLETSGE